MLTVVWLSQTIRNASDLFDTWVARSDLEELLFVWDASKSF